ncbi:VaFE repeat-containing surface-anchored protein [Enteroscipio rubneri]|uniref:VaFE repeat-containing surface-anchored protein n=1 Tax=Enteroscipio rubneri TaxID=2070686 RepID=UPI00320B2B79
MDAETGEPLKSGEGPLAADVTATVEFTPDAAEGTQTVELSFDSTGLGGHRLVVFEKLLDRRRHRPRGARGHRGRGPVRHGGRDRDHARRRRRRRPHGRERDGQRRGYRRV